ncbi:MAG: hypothetical protein WAX69_22120, partial [Victivallales bacterium]
VVFVSALRGTSVASLGYAISERKRQRGRLRQGCRKLLKASFKEGVRIQHKFGFELECHSGF